MLGPALQRFGIAIILAGGVDQLTKAAAWQVIETTTMIEIGLALAALGLFVTVLERIYRSPASDPGEGAGRPGDSA